MLTKLGLKKEKYDSSSIVHGNLKLLYIGCLKKLNAHKLSGNHPALHTIKAIYKDKVQHKI